MTTGTPPPVPLPTDWARLHEVLSAEWKRRDDGSIPEPPTPLILAGAAFSTADAVRSRWSALLDWAHGFGFGNVLASNLPPPPEYDVADAIAGVSDSGKGWWPEYGAQFHDPKPKHSRLVASEALKKLQYSWEAVVGQELARSTRPLRISGRKMRHLIVAADPQAKAPWGSWYSASSNRGAFSSFRNAVNEALAPIEVDHVTFNTEMWHRAT
jgi:Dna[CI] antecedent, DciA